MAEEQIKLTPHPTARVIRRTSDYVVDGIGKITVMTAIDAEAARSAQEPETLYQGFAILGARVGNDLRQFPVEFIINDAPSVEAAFDKFQDQAIATLKSNMDEARKRVEAESNRIIAAPASAVPRLKITT